MVRFSAQGAAPERRETTAAVAEVLGVPVRTVQRWVEHGLVRPRPVTLSAGRHLAAWTRRDLLEARVVATLVRSLRLPMDVVEVLMNQVRDLPVAELEKPLALAVPLADDFTDAHADLPRLTPRRSPADQLLLMLS